MLKQICNELRCSIVIETIDPLLIKSGKLSITGPDSNPVMTWRKGREEPEPFIPGSSLKGVFRSHLEKIIRTIDADNKTLVCVPYKMSEKPDKEFLKAQNCNISCGEKFLYRQKKNEWSKKNENESPPPSHIVYKESCPICRLFGSFFFKGRISISDGYLTKDGMNTYILETRDGVAIDRFTGGAATKSGAKFQIQVVTNGEFETTMTVRNFELWQLGLLGMLITDLQNETIQLGSGTSRGLGRIKGDVSKLTIRFFRTLQNESEIWGIGKCLETLKLGSAETYGLDMDDSLEFSLPHPTFNGAYKEYIIEGNMINNLFSNGADYCFTKLSRWTTPGKMKFSEAD
jgi:CRISPR-associated RAMP protein (TIGR02581 family)